MLDLDSPRWQQLNHAYGSAADVPDLIRAIDAEKQPSYRDGSAWFDVYSSLYHQHSIYSATYAAFPQLVRVTLSGTPAQRAAILCLAGNIRIFGNDSDPVPADLLPDYEAALADVKSASLWILREYWSQVDDWTTHGDLLHAYGGLRYPRSGYVVQINHMFREGWCVEAVCPYCAQGLLLALREEGIFSQVFDGRGNLLSETALRTPVERTGYAAVLQSGKDWLAQNSIDWLEQDTPRVLAALAAELGDPLLATRILDLGTKVPCVSCGISFELAAGLSAI